MSDNPFKTLLDNEQKFTIILGSGFHRQALGNLSVLSNWEVLLSKLSPNHNLSKKYTLDFEQIVIEQCQLQKGKKNKPAGEIEKLERKNICNFIKKEQEWVLSQPQRFRYPFIFNPKHVSDVISLNFDHIAEELCKNLFGVTRKIIWTNDSSFTSKNKNSISSIHRRTSYREVADEQGESIRFWYPHGSVMRADSMTLGVNKYAKLVADTIRIRDHYKQNENDLTWYSQIIKNPVLILGASISEAEWGVWSALVYKKRNFAKPENAKYEQGIYQMMSPEDSKKENYWFKPLFVDKTFNEQWQLLEECLTFNS